MRAPPGVFFLRFKELGVFVTIEEERDWVLANGDDCAQNPLNVVLPATYSRTEARPLGLPLWSVTCMWHAKSSSCPTGKFVRRVNEWNHHHSSPKSRTHGRRGEHTFSLVSHTFYEGFTTISTSKILLQKLFTFNIVRSEVSVLTRKYSLLKKIVSNWHSSFDSLIISKKSLFQDANIRKASSRAIECQPQFRWRRWLFNWSFLFAINEFYPIFHDGILYGRFGGRAESRQFSENL